MSVRFQDDWYVAQDVDVTCTDATTWVTLLGGCGGNRGDLPPLPGAVVQLVGPVSGGGTLRLADDASPQPTDRAYFAYDYYYWPTLTVTDPDGKLVDKPAVALAEDTSGVDLMFNDIQIGLQLYCPARLQGGGPTYTGSIALPVRHVIISGDPGAGRPVRFELGLTPQAAGATWSPAQELRLDANGGAVIVGPLVALPRATTPSATTPSGPRTDPDTVVPGEEIVVRLPGLTPSQSITVGFYDPTGKGGGGWEQTVNPTWEGNTAVVTLTVPDNLPGGFTYVISQPGLGATGGGPQSGGGHTVHVEGGPRPAAIGVPVDPSSVVPGQTVVVHLPGLTPSQTITVGFYDPTGKGGGGWEQTVRPVWDGNMAVVTLTVPDNLPTGFTYVICPAGPASTGGASADTGPGHRVFVEPPQPASTTLPLQSGTTLELRGAALQVQNVSPQAPFTLAPTLSPATQILDLLHGEGAARMQALARMWGTDVEQMTQRMAQLASWAQHDYPLASIRDDTEGMLQVAGAAEERRKKIVDETMTNLGWVLDQLALKKPMPTIVYHDPLQPLETTMLGGSASIGIRLPIESWSAATATGERALLDSGSGTPPSSIDSLHLGSGTGGAGAGGSTSPNPHDITIVKPVDAASTTLMQSCATGEAKKVKISIRKPGAGQQPTPYMTYELQDAIIKGVRPVATGDVPGEQITFNFASITVEYHETEGGRAGEPGAQGWR